MGAQLNIKDAETIELARGLAAKLGKSVTATIREALEEKAQQQNAERQAKIDHLNAIVDEFQKNMPEEWRGKTSKEIMDAIYDEDGLPI
jgi:antitoxin VapB